MAMQALVIAHAAYGHNSFFKGNYLFRMWTDASSIIDYLVYAQELRRRVRGAPRPGRGRGAARLLPRADEPRRRPLPPAEPQVAGAGAAPSARTARTTRSSRSTTSGARCRKRAEKAGDARRGQALPRRAAGEPAVLHREERAAARALAARDRAHRAQGGAVLLPAAPDAGDERGLGHLLAPHAAQHDVRRRLPDRRRDDRVAEVAHQRGLPAAGRRTAATAASTRMRWASRCTPTSSASARTPTDEDRALVPRHRRHATGCRRSTTRCATSRTRASSASTCQPEADARLAPVRDRRRRERRASSRSRAIHDDAGYRRVREALSRQYDLGSREPNIQVWNVNLRGDRSLTLRHTQHNDRPLHDGAQEVLKHVARLWGFGVHLESVDAPGRR